MYKVFSLISKFYRDNMIESPLELTLLMVIIAPIFHSITYFIVGLFYDSTRHHRIVGSAFYLIFFIVHIKLLSLFIEYESNLLIPAAITFTYIILVVKINQLWNSLFDY